LSESQGLDSRIYGSSQRIDDRTFIEKEEGSAGTVGFDDVGKERGRPIGREVRAKFPLTEV